MSDVTPPGETGTPKAPENSTPPAAPATGNADDKARLEQLQKEKDQAEMRANQLANQLKAKEDAEAAEKAKKLEEQNQFKELYEQEKAKREAFEAERTDNERKAAVTKAKSEILADYSDDVKAAVEETGISLESADEEDKAKFKERVEAIHRRIGTNSNIRPNNPGKPSDPALPTGDDLKLSLRTPEGRAAYFKSKPGIVSMSPNPNS